MHVGAHEGTSRDHTKAIALRRLDRPLRKRVGNASSAESGRDVRLNQNDRVRMTLISQRSDLTGDFRLQSAVFRIVSDYELSRGPDANASDNRIGGGIARRESFLDCVVQFVWVLHTSTSRRFGLWLSSHAMSNTCANLTCAGIWRNRIVRPVDRAKTRGLNWPFRHAQPQRSASV